MRKAQSEKEENIMIEFRMLYALCHKRSFKC
jgi:hypothetical protein